MPFEVFGTLFGCSALHDSHSNLEDAASCYAQLTQRYGGDIPIHPVSQKYVYWIAAIDRKGNQRNFSNPEREKAAALLIDAKGLETDTPGITTFHELAGMYYEALKLIPVSSINLEGIFDYSDRARHFWNSDAGKGQALAYAQQAAFTLELSLKAYLEVLGKLASPSAGDTQRWQKHELVDLFKLLTGCEMKQIEGWWNHSNAKRCHFKGTFREFLSSSNKLYTKWRYITDLTSANLSIDISLLLSASEFLLSASDQLFRANSPFQVKTTVTTYPAQRDGSVESLPHSVPAIVEGRVRSVSIPDGFDPFSIVEVTVDSEQHEHDLTIEFHKRDVEKYHDLEGQQVTFVGVIREDRPHLLQHADRRNQPKRGPKYSTELLTLRGSIYEIRIVHSAFGAPGKLDLALYDDTFFTQVECFFVTNEERDKLKDIQLGDKILIDGQVTLMNGRPMILVGPGYIGKVFEEPDD